MYNEKQRKSVTITTEAGKPPPQAVEIEEAILGAMLIDPLAYIRVSHYFKEDIVFYKDAHRLILNAIQAIHSDKRAIDIFTVTDKLKTLGTLDEIGGPMYLSMLTGKIMTSAHIEFHCMVITDKFLLRELIRIGQEIQDKAFKEEDPGEIAEWAENELLMRFDLDIEGKASFKEALHSTMTDIINKAKGIVSSFVKTGDSELDEKISFRERQICLIAGAEGSGKTKFMSYIARNILDNNPNVRVLWFSMEDSKEQIVRSFIAMDTRLTTKQMQSINYELTTQDKTRIAAVTDKFDHYNIEFIDRVCTIGTITRKSRSFRDKYKDDLMIIIIDNLGLISTDTFYKGMEKDDYLAGKIKEIADSTDSCMFVLHHITKEAARRFNIQEGYRPRKEYIKGSTRILDYVQQAVLVNLPRKYKDLLLQEKTKAELFNFKQRTGSFDKSRFIMEFWVLNPHGDKNTKQIPDLLEASWNALKMECAMERLLDGSPMGVGHIMNKYVEYCVYIDDKNQNREQQYHTEKLSIYSFITMKKYKEDYRPQPNSRTFYLYGNDMSRAKYINNLFIVESIKNRDGSDSDDNNIIRYQADLDYNIFIPLTDKAWEELKNNK